MGALLPVLALPLGAVTWWVLGFLPWLIHGLHRTRPTGGPFAPDQGASHARLAVPLLPEEVTALVTMAVIGGVAAVASTRLWRRNTIAAALCGALGCCLAAVVTIAHARHAAEAISGEFASDPRVVRALALIAVAATATGVALGLVSALVPVWLVPLALAAPTALVPSWVEELSASGPVDLACWVFAAAFGSLLGLCTRRAGHVIVWPLAAGIAWTAQALPPALTAFAGAIRPGYGLESDPWFPVAVGREVFTAALTTPEAHRPAAWLAAAVVAVIVAVVIVALRTIRSGRSRAEPSPPSDT